MRIFIIAFMMMLQLTASASGKDPIEVEPTLLEIKAFCKEHMAKRKERPMEDCIILSFPKVAPEEWAMYLLILREEGLSRPTAIGGCNNHQSSEF